MDDRARAVAASRAQFADLDPDERTAAHALVDAHITELAARQAFGPAARAGGQTTVSLDVDGQLVEVAPDGARRYL